MPQVPNSLAPLVLASPFCSTPASRIAVEVPVVPSASAVTSVPSDLLLPPPPTSCSGMPQVPYLQAPLAFEPREPCASDEASEPSAKQLSSVGSTPGCVARRSASGAGSYCAVDSPVVPQLQSVWPSCGGQQQQKVSFLGIEAGGASSVAACCATWSRAAVGVTSVAPAPPVRCAGKGMPAISGFASGSTLRAEAAVFVPAVPAAFPLGRQRSSVSVGECSSEQWFSMVTRRLGTWMGSLAIQ